jgi:hypothetical protein
MPLMHLLRVMRGPKESDDRRMRAAIAAAALLSSQVEGY